MRCACCDHKNTQWWRDNYYCKVCIRTIKEVIREDKWTDRQEGRYKITEPTYAWNWHDNRSEDNDTR